jgi:3-dehydroquinate dehydratase-2
VNPSGARGRAPLRVLVLHGPNLNLLAQREPRVYGDVPLAEIDRRIAERAHELAIEVRATQSNVEGDLINALHSGAGWADAVIINAGGYSHTSVAIRDAIAAVRVPAIAVHLSNPASREDFRHVDIVAGACRGVIAGFGWRSYTMALEAVRVLPAAAGQDR